MTTATYAPTAPLSTTPPQLQPYGLGSVTAQMIGGLTGHQPFGSHIGSTFGNLASLMPFGGSPIASPIASPLAQQIVSPLAQQQAQLAQQQALLQHQALVQQQAIAHQHAVAQHILAQQALAQQALLQQVQPYGQYGHLVPFGYWQN